MTDQTPIERADKHLADNWGPGVLLSNDEIARLAFESVDTDQLADVLRRATDNGADRTEEYALAVKNWLTGKDT